MKYVDRWGETHDVSADPRTTTHGRLTVDGVEFEAREKYGAWYEASDPVPSGTVGRLHMPMNEGGTPDIDNLGEIEVAYEEA